MKRLPTLALALGLGLSSTVAGALGRPDIASAQVPVPIAVEFCRELDEGGVLELFGYTRGECVNLLGAPGSDQANNLIAAGCGSEVVQAFLGVSNKGACIQAMRESE